MTKKEKIFMLLLCMLLFSFANAQEVCSLPMSYKPLLSEGKCWTMSYKAVLPAEYGDLYSFKETMLKGDTIINGIHYLRQYERLWELWKGEQRPEEWIVTNKYVGEDEGKVYQCDGTVESKRTIMDFSLDEKGLFPQYGEYGPFVTTVSDTILANSTDKVPRKCMHLSIENIEVDVWVEGVGSLLYGLDGLDLWRIGAISTLEKCVDSENILYMRNGSIVGVNSVKASVPYNGNFFDLLGRRLTAKPQSGLYIRNGKKYVVK